jgi:hypothetical protein
MTPRFRAAALALAATTSLFPLTAQAECATADAGARCIRVLPSDVSHVPSRPDHVLEAVAMSSASAPTALVDVGEVVPRGEYSVILNGDYYGLPPVGDGWVYMRIGPDAYRVDWQTHQVLERVTEEAAANF